jgi:hypothetical protein
MSNLTLNAEALYLELLRNMQQLIAASPKPPQLRQNLCLPLPLPLPLLPRWWRIRKNPKNLQKNPQK